MYPRPVVPNVLMAKIGGFDDGDGFFGVGLVGSNRVAI